MTTSFTGASVWEEGLYGHLTSHEQGESELLEAYQSAAEESGSPAFKYLVSLIVQDEVRHHQLFKDLADSLKADAELRAEEPAVPRLDRFGPEASRVIALTDQLLERERADAHQLHRLARELSDVKDTTLWQLLVKLMEMDTAKHVEILEFVHRHAHSQSK
jgi:hypothetical protein